MHYQFQAPRRVISCLNTQSHFHVKTCGHTIPPLQRTNWHVDRTFKSVITVTSLGKLYSGTCIIIERTPLFEVGIESLLHPAQGYVIRSDVEP